MDGFYPPQNAEPIIEMLYIYLKSPYARCEVAAAMLAPWVTPETAAIAAAEMPMN